MCTSDALRGGFCETSQLGRFILDLPKGMSINETSFWSARVAFGAGNATIPPTDEVATSGFWDNPAGNPHPPDEDSEWSSPWKRHDGSAQLAKRQYKPMLNPSPAGMLIYKEPIQYLVRKTGYYCVGALVTSD